MQDMQVTMMQAKIHRATVTQADLNYEGSVSIDEYLLEKSGILVGQQVDVLNINNGERFTTYAIKAERNSGQIKVNGAAARQVQPGDKVIIVAYALMNREDAKNYSSTVILVDDNNKVRINE